MDLIYTNTEGNEVAFISKADIDIEVSDDGRNDFCIEFKRADWNGEIDYGCRVFAPGTEYGGIVKRIGTDTSINAITVGGYTWRGMLAKKVIEPPEGADYALVSGELNAIIREMVEPEFPGLFVAATENTGVIISYQFERYCTLYDGLRKMLKSAGYRLNLAYVQGKGGASGYVSIGAVPVIDYSEKIELSQDRNLNFTMSSVKNGINHLICLGKGELKDRTVIHLYVDSDGKIGRAKYYSGADEVTEIYDSNGAEEEDLVRYGTDRLADAKDKTEFNMTIEHIDINVDIGDIVGGRDYLTDTYMCKPIGRKIWRVTKGSESIEYKLEGET